MQKIDPENLLDKWWRLNNLYYIINKYGKKILFKANTAQEFLFNQMHYMNLILKDRQRGMCLDPLTRVLTSDLRWVPIRNIKAGDRVIAVDEHPPGGRGKTRHMRTAIVDGSRVVVRQAYKIHLDDGRSLICTDKHPWLSRKVSTDAKWRCIKTVRDHKNADKKDLMIGTKIRWLTKPWGESNLEDYWFGGMLDGEGCMVSKAGGNLSVCQVQGPVWDRLEAYLKNSGWHYRFEKDEGDRPSKLGSRPVHKLTLSRMDEIFEALGRCRPTRFIGNEFWVDKEIPGKSSGIGWSTIVDIEKLDVREMIDLQTSTGTYIAEGFVSHNTTFIDLYILDDVLFYPDLEAGIIAHRQPDAIKIFRRKIKYPYDNLPDEIKAERPLLTKRTDELAFPNNSYVYVSTSMRSGTVQRLHLSEFGKVCAKFPEKAKEIVSGSLEAVHPGSIVWIESTAEGSEGYFYDYCQDAIDRDKARKKPNKLEFKLFFFGWTTDPDKRLDSQVETDDQTNKYFNKLEERLGITLTDEQKWWYSAKKRIQREEMKKENPATPEEAFEAAIEGAYYAHDIAVAREQGRIGDVPWVRGIPVDTWWDLGWDDSTSIWFTQTVGRQIHVIGYYENRLKGLSHYGKVLHDLRIENGWSYGAHTGPHDTLKHELGPGKTIVQQAASLIHEDDGKDYSFVFSAAQRINSEQEGINAVHDILKYCYFDLEGTTITVRLANEKEKRVGLPSIENYRAKWDPDKETYERNPLHNWASHGAKGFETMAITHRFTSFDSGSVDSLFGG